MSKYATQPCGVGVHRCLQDVERDHVVCLLRIVERLHLISDVPDSSDIELIKRQLAAIHRNHLELKQMAGAFLIAGSRVKAET